MRSSSGSAERSSPAAGGNNLFVAARVAGVKVEPVIGRLMPMFYALTASLFIVTFVPELSTWLPEQLGLITGP